MFASCQAGPAAKKQRLSLASRRTPTNSSAVTSLSLQKDGAPGDALVAPPAIDGENSQKSMMSSKLHATPPNTDTCESPKCETSVEEKYVNLESQPSCSSHASQAPIAGLANLGNTCFLNSVLYALRYTPGFLGHLHSLCNLMVQAPQQKSDDIIPPASDLVRQLHQVFVSLSEQERGAQTGSGNDDDNDGDDASLTVYPRSLLATLRHLNPLFQGNCQHDVHELLSCVLNLIREAELAVMSRRDKHAKQELQTIKQPTIVSMLEQQRPAANGVNAPVADLVSAMFEGVMVLRTRCSECENSTEVTERFLDVGVAVASPDDSHEDSTDDNSDWSLFREAIMAVEMLRGDNKYWCDHCQHHGEARRSVHLRRLPPTLVLQLRRFSTCWGAGLGVGKASQFLPTPYDLGCLMDSCPAPCTIPGHSYRLYGLITHAGVSLSSGHYVAFVRGRSGDVREPVRVTRSSISPQHEATTSAAIHSRTTRLRSSSGGSNGFASRQQMRTSRRLEKRSAPAAGDGVVPGSCCHHGLVADFQQPQGTQFWLRCDDDKVTFISDAEMAQLLSVSTSKTSALTPYLLFYAASS